MIVSETWKSRNISHYNVVQRKFSEAITFAFAFLFHEIHSTNRPMVTTPTNQTLTSLSSYVVNTPSPKEQTFGKLFANSLKTLMIYFINIIEYQKIKYTPT